MWAAAHPAAQYESRHEAAPCRLVGSTASCEACVGQPAHEVGARFYESWARPSCGILRRIPALHHLLGSAPGDGAAGSQEATLNRAEQE